MVGEETHPPDLIAGCAAVTFLRLAALSLLFCLFLAAAGLVLYVVDLVGWIEWPLRWALGIGVFFPPVLYVVSRIVGGCEARRGYTTLENRYRELWQVKPRTGEVIRRPGEPYRQLRGSR